MRIGSAGMIRGSGGARGRSTSGFAFAYAAAVLALFGIALTIASSIIPGGLMAIFEANRSILTEASLDEISSRLSSMGVDIDGDGVIEPAPAGSGAVNAPGLPDVMAASSGDGWDSPVRYCAYDHGAVRATAGLREGILSGYDGEPSIILISAGADGVLETDCPLAGNLVSLSGDDRQKTILHSEMIQNSSAWANAGTGNLSRTAAAAPSPSVGIGAVADTSLSLDVAGGARISGRALSQRILAEEVAPETGAEIDVTSQEIEISTSGKLDSSGRATVAGLSSLTYIRLWNSAEPCTLARANALRYNCGFSPPKIEICNPATLSWEELSSLQEADCS